MTPSKEEKAMGLRTSRFLKAELKRAGITYGDLVVRMNEMGFQETEASVTNKLARGTFAAYFFVAALKVARVETIRVNDI